MRLSESSVGETLSLRRSIAHRLIDQCPFGGVHVFLFICFSQALRSCRASTEIKSRTSSVSFRSTRLGSARLRLSLASERIHCGRVDFAARKKRKTVKEGKKSNEKSFVFQGFRRFPSHPLSWVLLNIDAAAPHRTVPTRKTTPICPLTHPEAPFVRPKVRPRVHPSVRPSVKLNGRPELTER